MKRRTIMVTGGAGFIGYRLASTLRGRGGARVFVVDNFSTSDMRPKDFPVLDDTLLCQVADVTDPDWVRNWTSAHWLGEVDEVYHLACPASPLHYQKTPVETLKTALVGTVNVLEIARALRCKVTIASTSEVYGDPERHPQSEKYLGNVATVGARCMYDEGKRAGEAAAWSYREQYGVDVRIARIFNTYGPGMATGDGRLIPNFVRQALRNEPITVYGDGLQTRSFCFVDDTVDALVRIMEDGHRDYLPIFNVGNPDERTVISVAAEVEGLTGSKGGIERLAKAKDDPVRRCPDITRIRTELGWEPKVEFYEGLARTVAWFRGRLST